MKRVALVTGASGGIGGEIARVFAKKGYNVVVHYHTQKDIAQALADEIGAMTVSADLSSQKEVSAMIELISQKFGGVDVLVNNTGIAQQKVFSDITEDDWDYMMNVNVKGMFLCTKAVLPHMIHEKEGQIINISSIWGITGASCEVHYSTSKSAIIGFTKALAKELGPSNIRVNCVAPGVIHTPMNKDLDTETLNQLAEETPLMRIGTPEDIAGVVVFLASEESRFITGQVISPNGGIVI